MPNRVITIEGSEGAGKSTNLELLKPTLETRGLDFFVTREPGGTAMAEEIRDLILAKRTETVAPITELLLMFAARAQHVEEVIKPRLAAGQWVLCDRFVDASYAYQGYGREVPLEILENLEKWVVGDTQPALTLFLDLAPEIGATRIADREKDRLELEQASFFERVRAGYLERARVHSRIKVVDASQSLVAVQADVQAVIDQHLNTHTESL